MVETGKDATTPRSRVVVEETVVITHNNVITTTYEHTREIRLEERVGGREFMEATRGSGAWTLQTAMDETGLPKHTVWRLTQLLLGLGLVRAVRRVRNLDSRGTFIYAYPEASTGMVSSAQRRHIALRKARRIKR